MLPEPRGTQNFRARILVVALPRYYNPLAMGFPGVNTYVPLSGYLFLNGSICVNRADNEAMSETEIGMVTRLESTLLSGFIAHEGTAARDLPH